MDKFYKNKKVLVTGHTGFKGSWLSQILLNWGAEVSGVSLDTTTNTNPNLFNILGLDKKIKNRYLDIRNLDELRKVLMVERPEIVFHLAAQPIVRVGYDDPINTITTNILGTTNVLQVVKEMDFVKSVVIITTDKVYKDSNWIYPYREIDPLGGYDPYSASKAAADIIAQSYIQSFFNPKDYGVKHNTLVTIARAGNVIGGGDWSPYRLVPDIVRAVYEKNESIVIRFPEAVRPWEHVLEPLSGYLLLGKKLYEKDVSASQAWNFGPSDESFLTVEELAKRAIGVLGKGIVKIESDQSKHETCILKLDTSKTKTLLGWRSVLDFNQTLDYTFTWYRNYYERKEDVVEFTDKQIKTFFKNI